MDYVDRRLRERNWRAAQMTGLHPWCKVFALQITERVQSVFILIYNDYLALQRSFAERSSIGLVYRTLQDS